ncbi:MAG: Ldh family oxidoreductase [Planctomycetota bacterium]|nr:Ldh family oxidoreductase [Planctomycetota bacterium]
MRSAVKVEQLESFCMAAMRACGFSESDARTAADVLVTTDTWGIHSHGTKALRLYLRRVRAGGLKAAGRPRVIAEGPAWATVDGDNAVAMISACKGMETAMAKAEAAGIGYSAVRNSCHFGAAGYYAWMAARRDMIGISMSNSDPNMSVPGARWKVIGNNPLAFAAPAGEEKPILLDMALSAVAAGKVNAAAAMGKRIPDNWIADEEGAPTTDPSLYPLKACLLPMAGHKGYGLAMMVETLSAVLSGAGVLSQVMSWNLHDPSAPTGHGHAFIAVNVGAMMPVREFKDRVDRAIREIRAAPRARGSERICIPGEIEWGRRERALAEGMDLPEDVRASLRGLAEDLGMTLPDWLEETR